jgi:hypothetical protein
MAVLENNVIVRNYSLQPLLNASIIKELVKVKTIASPVAIITKRVSENDLLKIKNTCEANQIDFSTFWHITVSRAHETETIAITDITNHPGIPGMFTELKSKSFNKKATSIKEFSESELIHSEKEITVVSNYMIIEVSDTLINKIESKEIKQTKYPYEWQFVQYNNYLEACFYFNKNHNFSSEIFRKWSDYLNDLMIGKFSNIQEKKTINDVFDDFDF